MREGIQNEVKDTNLQQYGCYYFCLIEWATRLGGLINDPDAIERAFERHKIAGWVEDDCFVVNPTAILNDLQTQHFFHLVSKTNNRPPEDVCLQYMKKPGEEDGHFLLNDKNMLWDPLQPGRPGSEDYTVDSYRRIV